MGTICGGANNAAKFEEEKAQLLLQNKDLQDQLSNAKNELQAAKDKIVSTTKTHEE